MSNQFSDPSNGLTALMSLLNEPGCRLEIGRPFTGEPGEDTGQHCYVKIRAAWTRWDDQRFDGDSLAECLQAVELARGNFNAMFDKAAAPLHDKVHPDAVSFTQLRLACDAGRLVKGEAGYLRISDLGEHLE